jgi:carboxymethylenebutenolidase
MTTPKITQAMIDAYDEYTHLTLDRRRFMDNLTKLAGSAAAAAAIAPLLAADPARAAIVPADDGRLKAEEVTIPGKDGGSIKGYLVRPAAASGKLPAVVVIHENRGLNDHIRDVARRVALEGFIVLAPDLLSPLGGTPADEDQARTMFEKLGMEQPIAEGMAVIDYLKADGGANGKVGVIGFCWGGGVVNDLAVNAPDLDAAVAYYGRQPKSEDVAKIKAPLLLHYAGLDERIDAGIDAYKAALEKAGKEYTVYVYDGVQHAFNNDTSAARYDKAAAELAWSRTIDFLKQKLS